MVKDKVIDCCNGPLACGKAGFIIHMDELENAYNSILIKLVTKSKSVVMTVKQSKHRSFHDEDTQTVVVTQAPNDSQQYVYNIDASHIWIGFDKLAADSYPVDFWACRILRICCADDKPELEEIEGWLEQILIALQTMDVVIDHIDLDTDDLETLITATNLLLTTIDTVLDNILVGLVNTITNAAPTFGTANAAGQVVLAANAARKYACIVNGTGGDVYLGLGANPAVGSGILLSGKGSSYEIGPQNMFRGNVYARRDADPDKNLTVTEGT